MKELCSTGDTDLPALFDDVRDHENFGVPRTLQLIEHVNVEFAKLAAEIDVLHRRNLLSAEQQNPD